MILRRQDIQQVIQSLRTRAFYAVWKTRPGEPVQRITGEFRALPQAKQDQLKLDYKTVCESCGRMRPTLSRRGKLCFECGNGNYIELTGPL